MNMGNMRELSSQEWELVSGGTITVTGEGWCIFDYFDWRPFEFDYRIDDGNGQGHYTKDDEQEQECPEQPIRDRSLDIMDTDKFNLPYRGDLFV